jgi:hypothetical protein
MFNYLSFNFVVIIQAGIVKKYLWQKMFESRKQPGNLHT